MPCAPCQKKREALKRAIAERKIAEAARIAAQGAAQMIGLAPKDKPEPDKA